MGQGTSSFTLKTHSQDMGEILQSARDTLTRRQSSCSNIFLGLPQWTLFFTEPDLRIPFDNFLDTTTSKPNISDMNSFLQARWWSSTTLQYLVHTSSPIETFFIIWIDQVSSGNQSGFTHMSACDFLLLHSGVYSSWQIIFLRFVSPYKPTKTTLAYLMPLGKPRRRTGVG